MILLKIQLLCIYLFNILPYNLINQLDSQNEEN